MRLSLSGLDQKNVWRFFLFRFEQFLTEHHRWDLRDPYKAGSERAYDFHLCWNGNRIFRAQWIRRLP
jgi:hypothetical protein